MTSVSDRRIHPYLQWVYQTSFEDVGPKPRRLMVSPGSEKDPQGPVTVDGIGVVSSPRVEPPLHLYVRPVPTRPTHPQPVDPTVSLREAPRHGRPDRRTGTHVSLGKQEGRTVVQSSPGPQPGPPVRSRPSPTSTHPGPVCPVPTGRPGRPSRRRGPDAVQESGSPSTRVVRPDTGLLSN